MPAVSKPKRDRAPNYLRAWREKSALTQDEVTTKLNWSQSKVSRIENGKTPYNQDDLEQLAALYQCTVVDLLKTDPADPNSVWAVLVKAAEARDPQRDQIVSYARFTLGLT